MRDGDPQVLAALCARRGPAVFAFTRALSEPYAARAAADAFARFRATVAGPSGPPDVHPDALLLGCARRAALELLPPGPELGCPAARELLAARAERSISAGDDAKLQRHLEVCPSCRGISARLAGADRAYREAEDEALPPEVTAAIVAALAAAAPVRLPGALEEPLAAEAASPQPVVPVDAEPEVADLREPEPVPEPEPEPEPIVAAEPEPIVAAEPDLEPEPEPEFAPDPVEPRLPYYQVPASPPRSRGLLGRRRSRQAAEAASSLTRWATSAARQALHRTEDPAPPEPDPELAPALPVAPDLADSIEPEAPAWQPEPVEEPPPVPVAAIIDEPIPVFEDVGPVYTDPPPRPAPRRRTPPPRLTRPRRHRHHRPLRDHSPRELAIPAFLLVAATVVIMAVAGVFGGGSSHKSPMPPAKILSSSPAPRAHPEDSATAVSLAVAQQVVGAATTP